MGQKTGILERDVQLQASDGAALPAFVAEPAGAQRGSASLVPRIVIAPEIFGLSPWIKSVARRLAHEGFRAVAPEIFARDREPIGAEAQSWMARMRRLDIPQAMRDLGAALDSLGDGKAASIGFCLGGALSLLTAAEGGLSACVDCYGRPRWSHETAAPHAIDAARRIRCPVLAVYGSRDQSIPVAHAEELRAALPPGSELAIYDAGHAFLNDTRPEMYVEGQATLAWGKIIGFLRRTLFG
jgi:carboxymethylenebutenolidase